MLITAQGVMLLHLVPFILCSADASQFIVAHLSDMHAPHYIPADRLIYNTKISGTIPAAYSNWSGMGLEVM